MFLFHFFVILRCLFPSYDLLGRSGHSRLLLCKLWESLWPKAISPDLIWRWASRNQGALFNTFPYHSLEWGEAEFDVTSLLPRRERKILEKVYYYQGNQTCETLGGIFQPTQAFPITKEGEKNLGKGLLLSRRPDVWNIGRNFSTNASFAPSSLVSFWYDYLADVHFVVLTSHLPCQCFVSLCYQKVVFSDFRLVGWWKKKTKDTWMRASTQKNQKCITQPSQLRLRVPRVTWGTLKPGNALPEILT